MRNIFWNKKYHLLRHHFLYYFWLQKKIKTFFLLDDLKNFQLSREKTKNLQP